ncbi:PAS domain S-box protein [Natrinema sp. 74]|uniref:PAS domain-containing sensor histidine kinase n=1 Tax=Natrinema sp. 74 TaxID=3384159 RepID=UPI0038D3F078
MESGPPNDSSSAPDEPDTGSISDRVGGLLEAADIACVRATPSGSIVAVNNAFTRLTGHERGDLRGRNLETLLADEASLASLVAALDERDASPVSMPVSLRTTTDAVPCTIHLERAPPAETGEAEFTGIVRRRDVSAASTATSESGLTYGRTFEALADALPDGIIVLDTNSDIRYANPAVERILGHEPNDLVGSSQVTIIPPRLRQTHLSALQRYLETGERHINWTYVELPGQHVDGHEVPLGVSLNDFTYDGDRYFVGLFRDISPRKAAERTLTEKVVQLESVSSLGRHALENPDIDDLLGKVTDLVTAALDAAYCSVFEHDPAAPAGEELRCRAATGFDAGEDVTASATGSIAAAALAGDGPVVIEDVAADDRFDGPSLVNRDAESGLTVAIGPAADPWGVIDVYDTDRREFADHDVDFLESVATIIATAIERQEYERRLNETVTELEASNERLEQFAYAASHDLQEPLRMVSSYLRLLEDRYADDLDSDGREFIAFAVDGADRMREMIDGLLAYSRVETRGDPFEPVDLESVLEDVLTDLHVMIERRDAEITIEGTLPTVLGDASQLRQVFQNLLSNAIEYSGDEPPRVFVSAERAGRHWQLSVEDEGIGIDPGDRDRVFRVFQRLHSREESDGTGIGLALCRRIVERHGGDIWVDSEPEVGSTFSFTIPASGPR